MTEHHSKFGASTGAAALDRALRHIQDHRGLGHGVSLHVDEDQCGALLRGQGRERLPDHESRIGVGDRSNRLGAVRGVVGVVAGGQRDGRVRPAAASPIEAGVHHDAVQPGGDGGVPAESGGPAVRGEQRVLDGVGGLLAVAERTQRHCPEPVAVPADQLTERVLVTVDVGAEELGV